MRPVCPGTDRAFAPWGEGAERSEADEGAFRQADRWNYESVIDTPPHPSSGFRETPDATFPPRGEGFSRGKPHFVGPQSCYAARAGTGKSPFPLFPFVENRAIIARFQKK